MGKICPLSIISKRETLEKCREEDCALYVDGECAIAAIARALKSLATTRALGGRGR